MTWTYAGTLDPHPVLDAPDLVAAPVAEAVAQLPADLAALVGVAAIDAELADTVAFCAAYGIALDVSANCVVVRGRRGGTETYAACVLLATTRADINGIVRRRLDARTASFAAMDDATARTGMEYGGITPVGLPAEWPLLIDADVAASPGVVVGGGVRASKLFLPGRVLAALPHAEVVAGLGRAVAA